MANNNFWKNKWIFVLAAVGSAAGLGNLWRFPFQVYDNGGSAFILAYLVMLVLIGIGLLIGEVGIGQKNQKGAPESLGSISKYMKRVGWSAVFISFVIVSYYAVVISWVMNYFWYSLKSLFGGGGGFVWDKAESAGNFFNENLLSISEGVSTFGDISMPVLIGLIITWIFIYLFTFKSSKSIGKVVVFTASIPVLTLIILAIRGITLPGGMEGISYLFNAELSALYNLDTWIAAAGQIFFTLSLSAGIMIAYGALKKSKEEIVSASFWVVIGNTLVSIISAIAVFGTLGFLAQKQGVDINEVASGGPGLVFTTFPEIFSQLPAFNSLFAAIFFFTVLLLAIDSAMSLVESVSTAIRDVFSNIKLEKLIFFVSLILMCIGIIFTFGNGLYLLDIVDNYITSLGMTIVGILSLLLFLINWKNLGQFIDERNYSVLRFVLNKWYLLISWIL